MNDVAAAVAVVISMVLASWILFLFVLWVGSLDWFVY
jgi:hypothetical protein